MLALAAVKPQLGHNRGGIFQKRLFKIRLGPCARHNMRAIFGANFIFIGINDRIQRGRVDQPLLRQQAFQRFYPQRRVGRQQGMGVVVIVIVIVMVMWHKAMMKQPRSPVQKFQTTTNTALRMKNGLPPRPNILTYPAETR